MKRRFRRGGGGPKSRIKSPVLIVMVASASPTLATGRSVILPPPSFFLRNGGTDIRVCQTATWRAGRPPYLKHGLRLRVVGRDMPRPLYYPSRIISVRRRISRRTDSFPSKLTLIHPKNVSILFIRSGVLVRDSDLLTYSNSSVKESISS